MEQQHQTPQTPTPPPAYNQSLVQCALAGLAALAIAVVITMPVTLAVVSLSYENAFEAQGYERLGVSLLAATVAIPVGLVSLFVSGGVILKKLNFRQPFIIVIIAFSLQFFIGTLYGALPDIYREIVSIPITLGLVPGSYVLAFLLLNRRSPKNTKQ